MKIAYKNFSTVIETSANNITSLVIEDAQALYSFLTDIKSAADGDESSIVVSRDETPIIVSKEVILITDLVDFNINCKTLVSKIVNKLDNMSVDERFYQGSQELLALLESHIMEMAMDFPCELFCEKLNMQSILKGVGIAISDDYGSLEERIIAYMDLVREFDGKKLFIFVNSRCMIPYNRFVLLTDEILLKGHEVLFVDGIEYQRVEKETRIIIDEDLCEI